MCVRVSSTAQQLGGSGSPALRLLLSHLRHNTSYPCGEMLKGNHQKSIYGIMEPWLLTPDSNHVVVKAESTKTLDGVPERRPVLRNPSTNPKPCPAGIVSPRSYISLDFIFCAQLKLDAAMHTCIGSWYSITTRTLRLLYGRHILFL